LETTKCNVQKNRRRGVKQGQDAIYPKNCGGFTPGVGFSIWNFQTKKGTRGRKKGTNG